MTKLSDAQLVVLNTACQRDDRCVFPVTLKLAGNAVGNVLKSLLGKGLVEEVSAPMRRHLHQSSPKSRDPRSPHRR